MTKKIFFRSPEFGTKLFHGRLPSASASPGLTEPTIESRRAGRDPITLRAIAMDSLAVSYCNHAPLHRSRFADGACYLPIYHAAAVKFIAPGLAATRRDENFTRFNPRDVDATQARRRHREIFHTSEIVAHSLQLPEHSTQVPVSDSNARYIRTHIRLSSLAYFLDLGLDLRKNLTIYPRLS